MSGIAGVRRLRELVQAGSVKYGVIQAKPARPVRLDPVLEALVNAISTKSVVVGVDTSGGRVDFCVPVELNDSWASVVAELYNRIDSVSASDEETNRLSVELMRRSGWVLAEHALVSPPWLQPGVELSYDEVHANGFDWINPATVPYR